MKKQKYFQIKRFFVILIGVLVFASNARAQNPPEPQRQQLLNGLKILMWPDAKTDKVTLKLRIHRGAAFDPAGKEGTTVLLGDILFPNPEIKAFFEEELEGSLIVTTTYDYIQVEMNGKGDQLVRMLDTLQDAIVEPPINKENFAKIRDARLKWLQENLKNPAYVADVTAVKRLYGDFPYGRSVYGTPETLNKIDFADLIFAKQRFLTSDNATMSLSGGINPQFAYRAIRQYFGSWLKADKTVPPTFRQPDAPDTKTLAVDFANAGKNEIRLAWRGIARSEKEFAAAQILNLIWQNRLGQIAEINHQARLLPGVFVVRFSAPTEANAANTGVLPMPKEVAEFMKTAPASAEFEKAKTQIINDLAQKTAQSGSLAEWWLDVDTYKLDSFKSDWQNFQNVTLNDVQKVAETLSKEAVVTVWVKKPAETTTANN
jgi:zinc protease